MDEQKQRGLVVQATVEVKCPTCHEAPPKEDLTDVLTVGGGMIRCRKCGKVAPLRAACRLVSVR